MVNGLPGKFEFKGNWSGPKIANGNLFETKILNGNWFGDPPWPPSGSGDSGVRGLLYGELLYGELN